MNKFFSSVKVFSHMVVTFVHVHERVRDGSRLQNQLKSKAFLLILKPVSNKGGDHSSV